MQTNHGWIDPHAERSTNARRGRRWRSHTAFALIASLLGPALACGDGDSTRVDAAPHGTPEVKESASIRIDPEGLVARLEGTQVLAEVPITGLATETGSIEVSLRSVDDARVFSTARAEYAVVAGETRAVAVSLALPEAASDQAALVKYNLVVQDGGSMRVVRSLQHVVPPYELVVEGPARLSAGKRVSYRVAARHALTRAPLPEQALELALAAPDGTSERHALTTDESGTASLELSVAQAGDYSVSASSSAFGVSASVAEGVEVASPGRRLLLTTDKPTNVLSSWLTMWRR